MPVGVPGAWDNSRCDSSSTEVGVLLAIIGHGPIPPKEVVLSPEGSNSTPTIGVATREARPRLLIRRLLIHKLVVPRCDSR
ncbi:hypothetical protein AVEN_12792-1 [Araneus ventricosus]|uniref:Uncharacterized protein n=1 Tax=Araneus ventricosus TaxID=182803 RepID=A0A4Y2ABL0_ARAVE|nr:hypothetical protein AVEN_12792-1 [Araneus ventricosus]